MLLFPQSILRIFSVFYVNRYSSKVFDLCAITKMGIIAFIGYTVKSLFAAAATIHFDEILVQNLLSKNYVLLRLLSKGGYYLRAATNNDFSVPFHTLLIFLPIDRFHW